MPIIFLLDCPLLKQKRSLALKKSTYNVCNLVLKFFDHNNDDNDGQSILRELHGKEKISRATFASVIVKNVLAVHELFKNLKKLLNILLTYFMLNYTYWTGIKFQIWFCAPDLECCIYF